MKGVDDMELRKHIFDTLYQRILREKMIWPERFNKNDRHAFLDNIIDHFEQVGEYEKCNKISKMKALGEFE